MEAMPLYSACTSPRLGVPHFQGGIPLPAPCHDGFAIGCEATAAHSASVAVEDLQLCTRPRSAFAEPVLIAAAAATHAQPWEEKQMLSSTPQSSHIDKPTMPEFQK